MICTPNDQQIVVPQCKKFVLELWSEIFENASQELNDGCFDICLVVIAQICDQLENDL